jgi:hypothetical protein
MLLIKKLVNEFHEWNEFLLQMPRQIDIPRNPTATNRRSNSPETRTCHSEGAFLNDQIVTIVESEERNLSFP